MRTSLIALFCFQCVTATHQAPSRCQVTLWVVAVSSLQGCCVSARTRLKVVSATSVNPATGIWTGTILRDAKVCISFFFFKLR
jgi:hypothetical protein